MPEVHEDSPEVLVVLLQAVIQTFDVLLFQKTNHLLLQLPAPLTGDDFHQCDAFLDRFLNHAVEFPVNLATAVVDVMQVQF